MGVDDCVKVIAAIAAAQVAVLTALVKLYMTVTENKRSLEQLHRRVTLGAAAPARRAPGGGGPV